ncbi:ribosome biogenesis GTP-binding protein YihA/YsxC [Anaerotalea alkaliphila]|uniref:Probable GTP-binding protein EngB n=1 Tax=Anaerotalea alkaliphila TaxID=2662126 RepID=A0A7X5HU71_9FIRM|nr:ribosome biogenesis GTP-binding protein YihA/YsxC [Anaerotalea alkaliphila]NDL66491.1 YihA family ribosome biogenesis GTP-binding protein [Anaerotalea alkaliphila]
MKVHNVFLEAVGTKMDQYPAEGLPEIAFVGKSNVGKSSLINGLINRKALARTSGQPGKTQTINFYNVEQKLLFVDLPGYGYAKVSKDHRAKWAHMIETYLLNRQVLRLMVVLVDIRHEPGEHDKMMVDWVQANGFTPLVVATKADKLSKNQVQKHVGRIRKGLSLKESPIIPFSSVTKQGKEKIWEAIEEALVQDAKITP